MTGNTKVWRAPLAGLAAVAMLATMGVAAGTANAADEAPKFKLSFNLNGHGDNTPSDITLGESSTSNYKVGSEWNSTNVKAPKADGWVFTGWYTSAKLGEGERFNTQAPVLEDTTLYAHWAKSGDTATVSFNTKATLVYPDLNQNGTPNEGADRRLTVAKGDKLSAWNAPTDGKTDDGQLLTGFTDKDGKADFDFTQVVNGKTLTAYATSVPSTEITLDGSAEGILISGTKDSANIYSGLAKAKKYEVAQDNPGELPLAGVADQATQKVDLVSN